MVSTDIIGQIKIKIKIGNYDLEIKYENINTIGGYED